MHSYARREIARVPDFPEYKPQLICTCGYGFYVRVVSIFEGLTGYQLHPLTIPIAVTCLHSYVHACIIKCENFLVALVPGLSLNYLHAQVTAIGVVSGCSQ